MNTGRLLVKGGAAVVGTALLAAAMWLYDRKPKVEETLLDPIRSTGRIGQVVATPRFRVQVQRVEAARSLRASSVAPTAAPVRTDGVYLVVRVRGTSVREPLALRWVRLETPGGYVYRDGPRRTAAQDFPPTFQPMIWDTVVYVFELPPRRLAGARLVLGEGGLLPQLTAAAEIDLGLTRARADELVRRAVDGYDLRAAAR